MFEGATHGLYLGFGLCQLRFGLIELGEGRVQLRFTRPNCSVRLVQRGLRLISLIARQNPLPGKVRNALGVGAYIFDRCFGFFQICLVGLDDGLSDSDAGLQIADVRLGISHVAPRLNYPGVVDGRV